MLGKNAPLENVVNFASTLPPADARLASDTWEGDWAAESLQIAQDKAYAPPIEEGDGPYTLDESYKSQAKSVAEGVSNWPAHHWPTCSTMN